MRFQPFQHFWWCHNNMCCRSLCHLVVKRLPVRNVNGDFSLERRRRRLARAHLNQVSVFAGRFTHPGPLQYLYLALCTSIVVFRSASSEQKIVKTSHVVELFFPLRVFDGIGQNGQRSVSHRQYWGPIYKSS